MRLAPATLLLLLPISVASGPSTEIAAPMAVAGYGMLVRESPHRGKFSFDDAIALANGAIDDDRGGYRKEFVAIAEATRRIFADRPR